MRLTTHLVVVLVAGNLAPLPCGAQEAEERGPDEPIEEIKALGARSLALMRWQLIEAENQVFDLFNELNEDDGYDIICKNETRVGSQLPKRVCQARMYREEVSMATIGEDLGLLPVSNMTQNRKHQQILIEKMRELAAEHPKLLEALKNRRQFEKRYEEERARRYGD